jgi:glycosyltransferase involved in cell wall biosynthesis
MTENRPMVEISVVVPVYGCRNCLRELHARIQSAISGCAASHEIVFVDDGSPDGSWSVLEELAQGDGNVKAIRLSRNFGQHAAITAGLEHARGGWIVVMDCDLQDPPEEIPRLLEAARSGYDIVLARRTGRRHSLFRRLSAYAFSGLMKMFNRALFDWSYGSFSAISRKVAGEFIKLRERDRHYLFVLQWLGFSTTSIEYAHAERHDGESSYSVGKLVKHAFDGIFFQTTVLLRWIVYLGFLVSLAGVLLAGYFVYLYFARSIYPGWTSLVVLILVIGGFIITSTGVAGLYVGKIFDQVKERPLYVVDRIASREPK